MQRNRQAIDSKRRTPRQARAVDTVEVIFEAAAQILLTEGRESLNTNHIAERAGISIGTLYQYFPNKQAILVSMARREMEKSGNAVIKAISDSSQDPHSDPVRLAVRALIDAFTTRRRARRLAMDALVAGGLGHELDRNTERVAQWLATKSDRFLPQNTRPIAQADLFVITRAVNGVLRSAAQEESPLLGTREFEDSLVRLVRAYLADIGQ